MFRLHRPDVLPVGDLGIVNAVQKAYRLRKKPTPDRMRKLGEAWKPYRSVACWYLWRSLDNAPGVTTVTSAEVIGGDSRGPLTALANVADDSASSARRRRSPCVLAAGAQETPAKDAEEKKWDVAADLGPTSKLAFDTTEGTWMNVDVSPDGQRIVFDLLGDIYTMPIDGSGTHAGDAADERARVRHAAALQPGRQAHRVHQRSRRPLEHLDDGRRRARIAKQVSRERRWFINSPTGRPTARTSTRAGTSSRSDRSAPARSGCTTSPALRRPAGHRAKTAGRRTPASPPSRPTAATSITARTSRPGQMFEYNKDPERHDLRDHAPRPDDRPRAPRRQRAGWIGHAAGLARRQDARVRPPRPAAERAVPARSRDRPRPRAVRQPRQGSAGSLGGPRPVSAVRVDARRPVDRDLGRRARSGRSTSRPARARRSRSPRASSRRSTRRCASRRRCTRTSSRCGCCATSASHPTAGSVVYSALGKLYVRRCRTASRSA